MDNHLKPISELMTAPGVVEVVLMTTREWEQETFGATICTIIHEYCKGKDIDFAQFVGMLQETAQKMNEDGAL